MKFAAVFTACMALLAMQAVASEEKPGLELTPLKIQQFFYEILFHAEGTLDFEEWSQLANGLLLEKKYYSVYDKDMEDYANLYLTNSLRTDALFFNQIQPCHIKELKGLFKFFYYAMDMEVMLRNMAWARVYTNSRLFVQALTLTVTHHKNLQNIILPEIDEIFPQLFVSSKYVTAVEELDWESWNRWIMMEKKFKTAMAPKVESPVAGGEFYLKEFKLWQWWKLMGLYDGWQLENKSMLREDYKLIRADPVFQSIYKELNMIWFPIDYTRDIEATSFYSSLSYFTEDRSWNKYWYYLNTEFSSILDANEFGLDRRGEWWMYNVQQLYARYNLESASNDLSFTDPIFWDGIYKIPYNPQMASASGDSFVARDHSFEVNEAHNPSLFNSIRQFESMLGDIVFSNKIIYNGSLTTLTNLNVLEFLGNVIQGNTDFRGLQPWFQMVAAYFGNVDYNSCQNEPSVMTNFETQLRDPVTYSIFNALTNMVHTYADMLPQPYTSEDLAMPGVKIVNVDVSELHTYFDIADFDMTTLFKGEMTFDEGKFKWDKAVLGRQVRLNHKPFEFKIEVNAEEAETVAVRIFLAPVINAYDESMDFFEKPEYYMKLDQFVYDLKAGSNTIERNSNDFTWTKNDSFTYSELYGHLSLAMEGKMEFNPKMYAKRSLFPDRLILPRGKVEGMPVALFVFIGPYNEPKDNRYFDDLPFGYPLEKGITDVDEFSVPNMFFKMAMIFHEDKLHSYFPTMYKYFGTFDEDFF